MIGCLVSLSSRRFSLSALSLQLDSTDAHAIRHGGPSEGWQEGEESNPGLAALVLLVLAFAIGARLIGGDRSMLPWLGRTQLAAVDDCKRLLSARPSAVISRGNLA
jgi:hypothetical protein